jgi:cobalt/nickel transport system permease protein
MHLNYLERKILMNKINNTINDLHFLDSMAERDVWINHIHPLSKLLVTIFYLIMVMSFDKYNLIGLLGMILYIIITMTIGDLPFKQSFSHLKYILLAILILGIANPIFDRVGLFSVFGITITSGMVSMVTLIMKAGFAIFASFILIETTSIEGICYALRMIRVPKVLVIVIMLIYRYIILMLKEAQRVTQAYSLRAPKQKGICYKAWGPLLGQMLIRSIDRAQKVYESMTLRGFDGEFNIRRSEGKNLVSIFYLLIWITIFIGLRYFRVFEIVGKLFL